jgi:hypothetical protein
VTGSQAAPEEDKVKKKKKKTSKKKISHCAVQYSDDEREDGQRVKGVRLFDESDFERFMTLVDSPASEWTLAGGPGSDQALKAEEVRVERRPCPKGQFFDVFRVTTVVDPAAFCGIENAVKQISSVLIDSA